MPSDLDGPQHKDTDLHAGVCEGETVIGEAGFGVVRKDCIRETTAHTDDITDKH